MRVIGIVLQWDGLNGGGFVIKRLLVPFHFHRMTLGKLLTHVRASVMKRYNLVLAKVR